MSVFNSPGLKANEVSLDNVVGNAIPMAAGIVGPSPKGNVDDIVLIGDKNAFIKEFGRPILGNYFHYSALAYLENGNQLYCKRIANGALYGGCAIAQGGGTNLSFLHGEASAEFIAESIYPNSAFYVFGKDPGVWNNGLSVSIVSSDPTNYEFGISVYQLNDAGVRVLVESWVVSRKVKNDGYGNPMFLETAINGFSNYIKVFNNAAIADTVLPQYGTYISLAQGSDGNAVTTGDYTTGWDFFANKDRIKVALLINAGATVVTVQQKMLTIAESRQDCLALLDIPYSALTSSSDMITWRQSTQNFNSSYCALYAPWVKVNDPFNNQLVTLPPSGYVASRFAVNDDKGYRWTAVAGEMGALNVPALSNIFSQTDRDVLYPVQINPIQMFPNEGIMIYGQKTEQVKGSATDRINVRMLLNLVKESAATFLRPFLFKPNNETIRFRVTAALDEYLTTLSAQGAFQTEAGDRGFRVECSTTNNTPATIAAHELHVDIYVKPVSVIEYIQLQVIVTPNSVNFAELIAKGFVA
jgi:phage tail sheath protein FI